MKFFYCTRDSVSGTWQDPVACFTEGEAIRSFCLSLAMSKIPESFLKDIDLYHVGSFDETSGHVDFCEPRHIISGTHDDVRSWRESVKYFDMEEKLNEVFKET